MIISEDSKKARLKVMDLLENRRFSVSTEEMNISFQCRQGHELITPPYRTDLHASLTFIVEFDSFDPEAEKERDANIWEQYGVKTVRLPSIKVLHAQPDAIRREIDKQLSDKERYPDPYDGPTCNHCKEPIKWGVNPESGKPRALNPKTGEFHYCMLDGTKDGAYYKDKKKYY